MNNPTIVHAIKKIRDLLTRKEKFKFFTMGIFALCISFFELLTASVIIVFAQVLTEPEYGNKIFLKLGITKNLDNTEVILYTSIAVAIIYLLKNSLAGIEVFYQNLTIQKACYNFKEKLLGRYAHANYELLSFRNSSYGIQVIGGDAEQTFTHGIFALATILSEGVVFVCLLAMLIYLSPYLAIAIFLLGGLIAILTSKYVLPFFYKCGKDLQTTALDAIKCLMQFFHGYKEIVLFGKQDQFVNAYQTWSKKRAHIQAMQTSMNSLPRIILEMIFILLFVGIIISLCLSSKPLSEVFALLSGYLYAGFRLMPGLNRIINQINIFKATIPSIERLHEEFQVTTLDFQNEHVDAFHFNDSIDIKNVYFKYSSSKENTLSDISLSIKKGEKVGIVGKTGSGKSTLMDIILGLLRPSKGSILIDGKYPVNCQQWHSKIGYVSQTLYLIDDSIEANIAFGEDNINPEKLQIAISCAQLEDLIHNLPQGTKTIVGERGVKLSGGEKQRIAIARALYRSPEVLIFDEATSALDNTTEKKLMETIDAISKDRTVIMIAHRLSSLNSCNYILQVENGKLSNKTSYFDLQANIHSTEPRSQNV